MSIPRFSLYHDITTWNGDIQGDANGQWVKWNDVEPYITFSEGQGFSVPEPQVGEAKQLPMFGDVDELTVEELFPEDGVPLDEGEDVYDLMTKYKGDL